jgi:hypothetical protein
MERVPTKFTLELPKKRIGRGNGINDLNKDLDTLWDNLEQ